MNALLSTFVPHLAWALLDFVWQGLLIGWFAALGFAVLRKARPQTRYAFGCAALLLCLALPLAGMVQRMAEEGSTTTSLMPLASGAAAPLIGAPVATPLLPVSSKLASVEQTLQAQLPLVILFWSIGAGLLALRMVLGLAWVRQRSQPGYSRPDPVWQARLDRLAVQFGVTRQVVLGLVDDLPGPVTAGWWRPVVLLPASLATGMPPDLLEALLAHEMAHIKRYDYLVNLIQSAIEIVLFYHPTVWWLSNRIRIEREQIADDLAASMLGEPRRLALALSELDQFQFSTPQLAHGAHGGNLMSRIKRLVRPDTEPLNWKMAMPILGLAAACAAFYANAQVAPAPGTPVAAPKAGAPAPAAKPGTPVQPKLLRHSLRHRDMAFALVTGEERNGIMMSGGSDNWTDIKDLKRTVKGDFLWYRKDGKSYIVQDPAIIGRLNAAHAPMKKLSAQMDVYGKEMDQAGKGMEKLSAEMERLTARPGPETASMRETERKMEALGREQDKVVRAMDKVSRRMDAAGSNAERETLSREMEPLSRQMEALSRKMQVHAEGMRAFHDRMQAASAPMEALGKQMEEAGKPMEAVGEKMGALGKVMEAEGQVMEKAVREAIDEAHAKGLSTAVK